MFRPPPPPAAATLLVLTLLITACQRADDDGPTVSPAIAFSTGQGYTFQNDTFPREQTLLVGVRIRQGDDGLNTFKVLSSYDGGTPTTVDSLPIGTAEFTFDKTITTRAVTGTEIWTFWVQETDGDIIKRSLTFTVRD